MAGHPTLTDPGHVSPSPTIRHPHKKPKGSEPTEAQTTYNKTIRGPHSIGQRTNSLLKTTFKTLRRISLRPWHIRAITKATPVPLHLEHNRPLPGSHPT